MGSRGWTAVLAVAGLGVLAAACGEGPTEPGPPEIDPTEDVSDIVVTVPPVDDGWSCEESKTCSDGEDGSSGGEGGDGFGGDSGGGSGGGGGSSGEGESFDPDSPEPGDGTVPPLGDDGSEDLSMEPPDCDGPDLKPQEQAWCDGEPPADDEREVLSTAADSIAGRCSFLSDDWARAKENLRLWTRKESQGFGGAAPVGGGGLDPPVPTVV